MTITEKERLFLEIYKGKNINDAIKTLYPEEEKAYLYEVSLHYSNINHFLSFIANPTEELYKKTNAYFLDEMIEMITSIIHASCICAIETYRPGIPLYRYEYIDNLKEYNNHEIITMKSTSKSYSEAAIFAYPNTVPLAFEVNGYCPFISMEDTVDSKEFKDEKEILFPPFLDVTLTDEYENTNGGEYRKVIVENKFDDVPYTNPTERREELDKAIEIVKKLFDEKDKGMSSELTEATTIIHNYLRDYAKNLYKDMSIYMEHQNNRISSNKKI